MRHRSDEMNVGTEQAGALLAQHLPARGWNGALTERGHLVTSCINNYLEAK